MSTAFSNRKMASSAPYRFSAHSRVRSLTCCLPFYTFRMEAAPGSAVPRQVDLSVPKPRNRKWLLNSRTWYPHCRMVRAATHEKVSAARCFCCLRQCSIPSSASLYDLTPLITDVANGKPASVLHMLSIHVRIAVDCQFEPLEQSCTINAPKS